MNIARPPATAACSAGRTSPTTEKHWLGRWINTSTAHNTHHARGRYNYSWYFLFWDRMMGTLSPDYDEHYRKAGFSAPEAKSR
ncbi:sterol desaturase family protein [Duganella vulcania]|uniref:sterol desaturase family protein n=1 Tax=Duganella vulcania TaxID=2692166 RepID=UPI0035A6D24E